MDNINYIAPETRYFKTKEDFDVAVANDFIGFANKITNDGHDFLVGLAHGKSPTGAYQYIYDNFKLINHPEKLRFTATNSHLKTQRDKTDLLNATEFLKRLIKEKLITINQIIGRRYDRDRMQDYADDYNMEMDDYLKSQDKQGFDFVFVASDSRGRVAGIERNSSAFESDEVMVVVIRRGEQELTVTPSFLLKSKKIAFLATKSDKRRALAWLYSKWGLENRSPSFLRHIEDSKERLTVYVDDKALTWPQIELTRQSDFGESKIKIDLAIRYNPKSTNKPVVLMVHGFLGLNSFDGLLTALPPRKYIAAAMHYGSIPDKLPPKLYSRHIVNNIDHVIKYFGEKGHPVYLFDHSMGNVYYQIMNEKFNELDGVKNYLKGRIGANPFFGSEAKHAFLGFLDMIIIPSFSLGKNPVEKSGLLFLRRVILPAMPSWEVRRQGVLWTKLAIGRNSIMSDQLWDSIKKQVLLVMTGLDSVPALNRIPIERALSRLPAKIFAIQIHSALIASRKIKRKEGLKNIEKNGVKIMILKSEKDGIAKYAEKYYKNKSVDLVGVTNFREKDLFREHLYHMVNPMKTMKIIDEFVKSVEAEA